MLGAFPDIIDETLTALRTFDGEAEAIEWLGQVL
jgi:hypothetical protein